LQADAVNEEDSERDTSVAHCATLEEGLEAVYAPRRAHVYIPCACCTRGIAVAQRARTKEPLKVCTI